MTNKSCRPASHGLQLRPALAPARRRAARFIAPALLFLAATTAYAVTTFLTVSPTNLQGWQIRRAASSVAPSPTPDVLFVDGPETPPLGTGSVEFRVGPGGDGGAELRHPGFAGTRLPNPSATATPAANELTELTYSTYTPTGGSAQASPSIILQIDGNNDGAFDPGTNGDDLLRFEPVYQDATNCPSNPQASLTTGQWQTWDAFDGCWYSLFGTAGSGPGTNVKTLRTISAAIPTGVIINSTPSGLGGVRLVTGFGGSEWNNYVGNADAFRIGVGGNDTVYDFEPSQSTPTSGGLLISEFRARCPAGSADEFVEIYNNSNSEHVVSPPDGSDGYGVATQEGALRCTVPFGTVIPPRGHFLCTGSAYSLSAYAGPDAAITGDIPDQPGLALFSSSNPANFNAGSVLDAVGYESAPLPYREGDGFQTTSPGGEVGGNIQYSFLRDLRSGLPRDTGDNEQDFIPVETSAAATSIGTNLGAPGPQNLSSPIQRNGVVKAFLIDPMQHYSAEPNSVRKFCSPATPGVEECNANRSQFGTFSIRRRFKNKTGANVTLLRFRIVDITTGPTPPAPTADLRAITSPRVTGVLLTAGNMVDVEGTTLEEIKQPVPPESQPLGGGYNSTLAVGTVDLSADPLVPDESINLQFLLGVQQPGNYRFYVNVEAGPPPASGTLSPVRATPPPSKQRGNKGSAARRR